MLAGSDDERTLGGEQALARDGSRPRRARRSEGWRGRCGPARDASRRGMDSWWPSTSNSLGRRRSRLDRPAARGADAARRQIRGSRLPQSRWPGCYHALARLRDGFKSSDGRVDPTLRVSTGGAKEVEDVRHPDSPPCCRWPRPDRPRVQRLEARSAIRSLDILDADRQADQRRDPPRAASRPPTGGSSPPAARSATRRRRATRPG